MLPRPRQNEAIVPIESFIPAFILSLTIESFVSSFRSRPQRRPPLQALVAAIIHLQALPCPRRLDFARGTTAVKTPLSFPYLHPPGSFACARRWRATPLPPTSPKPPC